MNANYFVCVDPDLSDLISTDSLIDKFAKKNFTITERNEREGVIVWRSIRGYNIRGRTYIGMYISTFFTKCYY